MVKNTINSVKEQITNCGENVSTYLVGEKVTTYDISIIPSDKWEKDKKANRKIGKGYKGQHTDEIQMASDYKKLSNHCPRGYA